MEVAARWRYLELMLIHGRQEVPGRDMDVERAGDTEGGLKISRRLDVHG